MEDQRNNPPNPTIVCRLCKRSSETDNKDYDILSNETTELCDYCHEFRITDSGINRIEDLTSNQRKVLSKLSCMHFMKNGTGPYFIKRETIEGSIQFIPRNAIEQLNYLLETIAEMAPNLGQPTNRLSNEEWAAICLNDDAAHFRGILKVASEEKLIEHHRPPTIATRENVYQSEEKIYLQLTMEGWEYLNQKPRRLKSKKAFVAMWFHQDLNEIFDKGIYPALDETGYQPDRVDRTNHENRIDDAIISKIRTSSLVVADVTGERSGVYYEAGFAEGLGIPVIWLCNESWRTRLQKTVHPNSTDDPEIEECTWKDRIHFDTRQLPHIFWSNAEDLKKKLIARIQARNLDLKLNGQAG
jgi:nucleoside 2-deoxyribosyltransferase